MHERDDGGVCIDLDLVGPGDDDLVGARHALACRKPGAWIDDDRAPAEWARQRAECLGDVAGADRDEARRRRDRFREDGAGILFAQLGPLECVVVPSLAEPLAATTT